MSTAKEIADQGLAAWRARDIEALAQLYAEDSVTVIPGSGVELHGPDGFRQFYLLWNTAFPDNEIAVDHEYVAGSTIIQEATFSGTHTGNLMTPDGQMIPPTGRRGTGHYCGIWTIEGGLITRYALFFDQVELLAQLGLMSPMAAGAAH